MQISQAELLKLAREEVRRYQQKYIRSEHLMLALLDLDSSLPMQYAAFAEKIAKLPFPKCGAEETLELAAGAQRILQSVEKDEKGLLSSQNLFDTIIQNSPLMRRILSEMDTAGRETNGG